MNPPSITQPTTTDVPDVPNVPDAPEQDVPDRDEPILDAIPVLGDYVRGSLIGVALLLIGVFVIAACLNPYNPDGTRRANGTHQQLGLMECGFLKVTGVPCPSCGMTTSFALLIRGDLIGSLWTNAAGTGLAIFALFMIFWCLASAWYRQTVFVRSIEWPMVAFVAGFTVLTVGRWIIVVVWILCTRTTTGS
jgi:hypothetical protein